MERNLHILSRISDTASFLYVEHAAIERSDGAVQVCREGECIDVPAASISTLVLGPGTRITHAAVVALAESGAGIVWAGEELQRFYAAGIGKTRSSSNLLRQAVTWAHPSTRLEVVRRMYCLRFPEKLPLNLSLAQIRGREGVRVRDAYARASKAWGVAWSGRHYERGDWNAADPVNRALSAGSTILYAICHGAISAAGYSPGIGFIHTGKALSFVYDVADFYKMDLVVPAAFEAASIDRAHPEATVRRLVRQRCYEFALLERVMRDLVGLFDDVDLTETLEAKTDVDGEDRPTGLWDENGLVEGGINHGRDDA